MMRLLAPGGVASARVEDVGENVSSMSHELERLRECKPPFGNQRWRVERNNMFEAPQKKKKVFPSHTPKYSCLPIARASERVPRS